MWSIRLATTLALVLVLAATVQAKHDASGSKGRHGCGKLVVDEPVHVEVPEVSGLAALTRGSSTAIYVVGDASYRIARVTVADSAPQVEEFDAAPSFRGSGVASQWEAAADGGAGLCVLSETTARVSCFDQDLRRLIGSFTLDVSAPPDVAAAWEKDPNSRGEGMVLLRRAHVLLLKEKKPPLLIELGPAGDAAIGFGPDAVPAPGSTFEMPKNGTLVVLAVWRFSDSLQAIVADGSELAVGPDHRLYLMSEESRMLVRLERQLRPTERAANADACWRVPKELEHPEGLVIDAKMRPWIGVDAKKTDRPTVFRMRPLTAEP